MNTLRTWIEINRTYFDHNVSQYKKIIGTGNLSIVVKANAYGHGIEKISMFAQENPNIHSLCVATLQEALLLREIGITKPIFLIGVLDGDPHCIIGKNISLSCYDLETAAYLESIGQKHNYRFKVHIKIDTGLSRLGIQTENAIESIRAIQKMPHLEIEGIYSHCAESQAQENAFTLQQRKKFKKSITQLKEHKVSIPLIHFANSAATSALDLSFCNLFRVGIGAYGLWPSIHNKKITQEKYPGFDLKQILTWKTIIRAIKTISKGSSIGYDRTYRAEKDMRIAILPLGYYDGYDFRLFNKGTMIVHNAYAPIIGRISMNMCSIDITDIPEAQLNDEVIIMGPYLNITPFELGSLANNPNVREMTTKINPHVPRIITTSETTSFQKEPVAYPEHINEKYLF